MADPRGFLRIPHVHAPKRPPEQRVRDHKMIFELMPVGEVGRQARRCMDCGVPFCQDGCPVGNRIPRWNDLVGSDRWREALDQLHATNDFPEFTGYICPAPCESACVLAINSEPVTIKQVELEIIERGWREGWVRPRPPRSRTGRRVAVVGSGPAGLAAAAQLNARGHTVTVYERSEAPGGLMRIGVPDFKLAKWVIDRRIGVLEAEGIEFRCGVEVGTDLDPGEVRAGQDAVVLTVGALRERPLDVPGAGLGGVHFAMEYLAGHNRLVARTRGRPEDDCGGAPVTATGKRVAVIGGGDTAADCIATALREGAAEVRQLDRYPRPDGSHTRELADWPAMPRRMPTTYALEEGGTRRFAEAVIQLTETDGQVSRLHGTALDGPPDFTPRPGSEFDQPVDLVLVAVGFLGPERRVLDALGPGEASEPGAGEPAGADGDHVHAPGVFLAGDARLGASLVVTAIDDGRRCAAVVDRYLRMSASPPALAG